MYSDVQAVVLLPVSLYVRMGWAGLGYSQILTSRLCYFLLYVDMREVRVLVEGDVLSSPGFNESR